MRTFAFAALISLTSSLALAGPNTKSQVAGTWLLNGKVKAIRIIFKKDGTFDYAGQGATSKGKWALNGSKIRFNWTHIDGQTVKPGSVAANFPAPQDGAFKIGKFVYRKP